MEIVPRFIEKALREAANHYPVVTLTGPRQSDKTGGATSEGRAWECKSGMTVPGDFFRHLVFFGTEAGLPPERRILAYGGMESQTLSDARVLGWQDALLEP